jgi:hypothetical protein
MIKPVFKKNTWIGFILILLCLIHLPVVFAMPKPAPTNLFYHPEINNIEPGLYLNETDAFSFDNIYDSLQLEKKGLSREVFDYALRGFKKIKGYGLLENDGILSIADFSKPSSEKRLFIIDVKNCSLLFNTYVAHGAGSGKEFARAFSNVPQSNKSSLGFYKTADTYAGRNGYSLHLIGLEKGFNDNAYRRDIVIHAADYVNESMIRVKGSIGRSWGCPAVPLYLGRPIIDKIKNGTCFFIFGTDKKYLLGSSMLRESANDFALK